MKITNKKMLEEIIRVDHAGERGAIKIYEGQLLALKTFMKNACEKYNVVLLTARPYKKYFRISIIFLFQNVYKIWKNIFFTSMSM